VQAETHTSADITLVTAEGDKVTLSTDAVLQAAYTRYDAHGRLRGYGLERHAETFQMASASDISLQIEGDLNDAERAEIQQALGTIEQFAADFFNGKGDEAPNQIFNLGNLNTLRNINATLEFSQSLIVSQQTETRAAALQCLSRMRQHWRHSRAPHRVPRACWMPSCTLSRRPGSISPKSRVLVGHLVHCDRRLC